MLLLLYPMLCRTLLSIFDCVHLRDEAYLRLDVPRPRVKPAATESTPPQRGRCVVAAPSHWSWDRAPLRTGVTLNNRSAACLSPDTLPPSLVGEYYAAWAHFDKLCNPCRFRSSAHRYVMICQAKFRQPIFRLPCLAAG